MDSIVVFSACPQDMLPINNGITTEAHFEVFDLSATFPAATCRAALPALRRPSDAQQWLRRSRTSSP